MRPLAVPRTSYFVATAGQPRVRRPTDIFTATMGPWVKPHPRFH
jgi:hypothetical protein